MTRRLREVVAEALDELEAGNTATATLILLHALDDAPVRDKSEARCRFCGRWPGQVWSCAHVRECSRMAEAA